jgi:DSF synthase
MVFMGYSLVSVMALLLTFNAKLVTIVGAQRWRRMKQKNFENYYSPQYFKQVAIDFKRDSGVLWVFMKPSGRACITPGLLRELRRYQQGLVRWGGKYIDGDSLYPVEYQVTTSGIKDIFNYGGDLELFLRAITNNDQDMLLKYGTSCVDVVYANATNYDLPITTISLVCGDAMGGGLEGALSSGTVIAERGVKMGFPEIMFNLFPGMGGYNFLCRKVAPSVAKKIITSGQVYTSEEFYEMGIVDLLAETGKGVEVVNSFVEKHRRNRHGYCAFDMASQQLYPVNYESLINIVKIWVDAAMRLTSKDLKIMKRLAKAQVQRKSNNTDGTGIYSGPVIRGGPH